MTLQSSARVAPFGTLPDGDLVRAVTLRAGGTTAVILTHGARLADLRRDGVAHPLVLGSATITPYLGPMEYFGAIVGPVANRISEGRFTLDDAEYRLDRNEAGRTTLHGGSQGFSARNWRLMEADRASCALILDQRDGLCGFPGPLSTRVRYELDEAGALNVEITARTARPCLCAPAFHAYWNLDGTTDLSGHTLTVHAASYLPLDADGLPREAPRPVAGTTYDYQQPRAPDVALDHNFCLATARGPMRESCRLSAGDLTLILETTEPGLQVFTAGTLDTAPFKGLTGAPYGRFAGIALEPQLWPDAANRADFPSPRLDLGQTYRQNTRFRIERSSQS